MPRTGNRNDGRLDDPFRSIHSAPDGFEEADDIPPVRLASHHHRRISGLRGTSALSPLSYLLIFRSDAVVWSSAPLEGGGDFTFASATFASPSASCFFSSSSFFILLAIA